MYIIIIIIIIIIIYIIFIWLAMPTAGVLRWSP